jgi:membrane protein
LSTATEPEAHVGHSPSSPTRLRLRDWIDAGKRAARGFLDDDAFGLAAQIAYSSLLAFFPAMIFLVGLLGLLGIYDDVKDFLGAVAPGAVIDAIDLAQESSKKTGSSAVAVALGAAGALWAASGAMASVIKAVNRAYERIDTRPFWKVWLTAVVLVVATALSSAATLLLVVFGGPIGEAIADWVRLGGAFDLTWAIVRWPLTFVAILLFFALVYYLAPDESVRNWKWISPGSLVGATLWLGLSGLFALYTSFSDSYDRTYGSLAGGIVLLLWLDYSAVALLLGAELNAELDRQADIRAAGGPNAGLVQPARRTR